jgi:hypothetical protein
VSQRAKLSLTVLVLAVAAMLLAGGGKGCSLPTLPPSVPPSIVMLYEAENGELPAYAIGAARELEAAGRDVNPVDDDTTNGLGETPKWLKPALEPGRKLMGGMDDKLQKSHALVLVSGEQVVKAVKLPESKEAILEAVK